MNPIIKTLRAIPIISYIVRYWPILMLIYFGHMAMSNEELYKQWGALIFIPVKVLGVIALAFLIRHVTNRGSTEPYVNTGKYDIDFRGLTPIQKVWITVAQVLGYLLVAAIASQARAEDSNRLEERFMQAKIRPEYRMEIDELIPGILRDKARYVAVQNMRPNGMPWFLVAAIHNLEASRSFNLHLHEGSTPLRFRTKYVPKNRPPGPPPFTWTQSAEDALYILKRSDKVRWSSVGESLSTLRDYNGTGYDKYHPEVPTPYLWSKTDQYKRGKYVADGKWSSVAVSSQIGAAALWIRMKERGVL